MIRELTVDEDAWDRAGVGFRRRTTARGEVYRFELEGRSDVVEAEVVGDRIILAPERSAAHRALLTVLEP